MRPEKTPYGDQPIQLYFEGGSFYVLPALIASYPKLDEVPNWSAYSRDKNLKAFSHRVGHVLIHYLLTGTYQCLEKKGASSEEKSRDEFTTSIEAYKFAEEYELSALKDLAKGEIERVGRQLQVTQVLDLLKDVYQTPRADDMWLHNYIKSRVEPLLDNPTKPAINDHSETLSFANFLLRAMVELYLKKLGSEPFTPSDTESKSDSESGENIKRQVESEVDCKARKGKKRKVLRLPTYLKSEPGEE
ncbi:hypothetical protein F4820DRAFT_405940 [Hypoxylon rubiginosum]|uniref:Uncharacterized protein n=1 Tax=Hypoxylon rubiginosum TaxID=110542 RepID=A0ACB9ZDU7_9PEZI|nr:hypothetical protein F4820DRAFT_405940 [Hypoxylon rubiginosum]